MINIGDMVCARWWAPCRDVTVSGNVYNALKLVEIEGVVKGVTVEHNGTFLVVQPGAIWASKYGDLLGARPQSAAGYPVGWVAVRPEWLVWPEWLLQQRGDL